MPPKTKHLIDDDYYKCLVNAAKHNLQSANSHHRYVLNTSHSDGDVLEAQAAVNEALGILDFLTLHSPREYR